VRGARADSSRSMRESVQVETSKTKTCIRSIFDTRGIEPYYTRPMAAGLPDIVDCARLAEDSVVLERTYDLRELPRLKDSLAESSGILNASFAFSKTPSGLAGARVEVHATPRLTCQRCMQGFAVAVSGGSEVEFASEETAAAADGEHEVFHAMGGRVSLRDLAEEELLLALPIAPMCAAPLECGNAPDSVADAEPPSASQQMRRPFSALQDLLRKDRT
jgi:DUF177 domain-containing protein